MKRKGRSKKRSSESRSSTFMIEFPLTSVFRSW